MEPLHILWFALLGVLLAGYGILDGFDLGVGILHLCVRKDEERRVLMNSIGPLWDGNEVWLVVFGGAMFAAFPARLRGGVLRLLHAVHDDAGGADLPRRVDGVPRASRTGDGLAHCSGTSPSAPPARWRRSCSACWSATASSACRSARTATSSSR